MQNSATSVNPNLQITPNYQVIVKPPAQFYKYSIREELEGGDRFFNELVRTINQPSESVRSYKRKSAAKKIIGTLVIAGLAVLGYRNKEWLAKQWKKIPHLFGKK